MGLARVALPIANSTPFQWSGSFADLDDGPPIAVGSGTVDPTDDSNRVSKNGLVGIFTSYFTFRFAVSSDYISNLTFTIRVFTVNDLDLNILIKSAAGSEFVVATFSVSGGPTTYSIVSTDNPIVSRAWDPDDLAGVNTFGFRNSNLGDISDFVYVSSFYITTNCTVGPTTSKGRGIHDNWRWCDVCGRKTPYASIRRPVAPHPQAGLSVCGRCYDELDHETRKAMSGKSPIERPENLY